MAVMIRLARQGKKHQPQYQVVVTNKDSPRETQFLDTLGRYFPKAQDTKAKLEIDREALKVWQAKGAQVSQTVGQLLKTLAE